MPASGGAPEALTTPDAAKDERAHGWPHVLPDGKAVLFSIQSTSPFIPRRIAALSLETGEYHTVLEGGYFPHYAPSGHLLYVQRGTLMAAPFDLEDLRDDGPFRPGAGGDQRLARYGSRKLRFLPGWVARVSA